MKTAISIPDDLYDAAEKTAAKLGVSRSELYRRALRSFLERHSERLVTEALDAVYADEPGASALDPGLEQSQFDSLDKDEW